MDVTNDGTTQGWQFPPSVDVLLADGSIASIRPLIASDRSAVTALFDAASEQSLYSRFFAPGRHAAERYVSHIFEPDSPTISLVTEVSGEIVGLANAESSSAEEAEVAFLVADRVHGLGIGTLLLEHLAALSRHSGIRWFVAEVLASNVAMLRVFHDAGFHAERQMGAGVVVLRMATTASAEALEAADAREAGSERRSLEPLLMPRSVAVVGVSRKPGGVGRSILQSIRDGGYEGAVFVIHPQGMRFEGFATCTSFDEVPVPVDLVVVAVPAPQVMSVLRDAAAVQARAVVIVTSGFGEFSETGKVEQSNLVRFARSHNMRIVGPNCLGLICNGPTVRLNATFGCPLPAVGGLAVASQSGGVGIALLEAAERARLGIAYFVSLGNKADVSGNDLIEAWIEDPEVRVGALYLESFGNPLKFARVARRFSQNKPLLAIVGGRSTGGQRAGASHTAAAASPGVAIDALFAQAGVIGCHNLDELVDTAALLSRGPAPPGRRTAVVSNAGGLGVLAADAAADQEILVPEFSSALRERIAQHVTGTVGSSNPIDLGAGTSPESLSACVAELLDSDEVDSLIVLVAQTSMHNTQSLIYPIERLAAATLSKPILVVRTDGEQHVDSEEPKKLATYESAERAVTALSNVQRYEAWRQAARSTSSGSWDPIPSEARGLVKGILAGNRNESSWLTVAQAREILGRYGVNAPEGEVVTTLRDAKQAAARLGFPVTIKTADPTIVHKTDLKLVIVGLRTLREVHSAALRLRKAAGTNTTPLLVQHHVGFGVEVALGLVRDPRFGPLVMAAAGGTAVDVLDDRAFLQPPYSNSEALHAIHSLRIWPILAGYRGEAPADVNSLAALMETLGILGRDIPEVAEIDLNPVIVTSHGFHCVDVKIRIAPVEEQIDAGIPRSLRTPT